MAVTRVLFVLMLVSIAAANKIKAGKEIDEPDTNWQTSEHEDDEASLPEQDNNNAAAVSAGNDDLQNSQINRVVKRGAPKSKTASSKKTATKTKTASKKGSKAKESSKTAKSTAQAAMKAIKTASASPLAKSVLSAVSDVLPVKKTLSSIAEAAVPGSSKIIESISKSLSDDDDEQTNDSDDAAVEADDKEAENKHQSIKVISAEDQPCAEQEDGEFCVLIKFGKSA